MADDQPELPNKEPGHKVGVFTAIDIPVTSRVLTLTDGVFAIAMTILILDIRLPPLAHGTSAAEFNAAVLALWPKLGSYMISFLLLAKLWEVHRYMFHFIRRCDYLLLWVNNMFLLCVTLLPFSTSLIGEYPQFRFAASIYSGNMLAFPCLTAFMWYHATRRMTSNEVPQWIVQEMKVRWRRVLAAFSVAFATSFFRSDAAILLLLIFVALIIIMPLFLGARVHGAAAEAE